LFENAMKAFNPIAQADNTGATNPEPTQNTPDPSKGEDIDDLKTQLNAMQAQLAKLAKDQD